LEGSSGKTIAFAIRDGEKLVFKDSANVYNGAAKVQFQLNEPKLWYPHGYGDQTLYEVTATVSDYGFDLDQTVKRTGFRRGELVQVPDAVGKTFFFRVNNVDIFCGGSDWIPADSFLPRVSAEKYRRWLQMLVDGYQVMIR
jgi:beta-mannosidase